MVTRLKLASYLPAFCSNFPVSTSNGAAECVDTMEEKSASYERVVYKNPSEYHYMKINLVLENANTSISAEEFKHLIICGLKDLYGEVGAAIPFDVLTFDQTALSAILRVYNSGLVKLWSALTLIGSYANELCAFRVTQVSPFLLALSGNSREMEV